MIVLNDGGKIPDCKSVNKQHQWRTTKRPDGNRSGWHEQVCEICGQEIGYDDSD